MHENVHEQKMYSGLCCSCQDERDRGPDIDRRKINSLLNGTLPYKGRVSRAPGYDNDGNDSHRLWKAIYPQSLQHALHGGGLANNQRHGRCDMI
jgi:hypothetical protein